jgi:hypothetical protein
MYIDTATAVMQTACKAQILSARLIFVHGPVVLLSPQAIRAP